MRCYPKHDRNKLFETEITRSVRTANEEGFHFFIGLDLAETIYRSVSVGRMAKANANDSVTGDPIRVITILRNEGCNL